MKKIILSMNITKDGFVAGPNGELDWHLPFWNSELCESLGMLLSNVDTILLGRNTYTALAAYWPFRGNDLNLAREDIALADMMNRYSKVVVSKTLKTLVWMNSSLIQRNILQELTKLKQQSGKDIIVIGSSVLVTYLIKHNLIDEYHLWMHPISIKKGERLSELANYLFHVQAIHEQYFSTGVIKLTYFPNTFDVLITSEDGGKQTIKSK